MVVAASDLRGALVDGRRSAPAAQVMNRQEVNQTARPVQFRQGDGDAEPLGGQRPAAASKGNFAKACYFLALIWSNGLLVYLFAAWASLGLYRRGYQPHCHGRDLAAALRRRTGSISSSSGGLFFLKPTTRILLVKDFRTFRRDPQQWAQMLIFSGLMFAYIDQHPQDVHHRHSLDLSEQHQPDEPVRRGSACVHLHRSFRLSRC